jgi:hypothetical protein
MSADIVTLPTAAALTPPVAQFVRLGEAHRKLEDLLAEDRFPAKRVVVEAARLLPQKRSIEALRKRGVEIVLDPQVAELAAPGKYLSNVRRAPWGRYCQTSPLGPQHFRSVANSDVIGEIARFAVTHGVDVVFAPTHFLADPLF